MKKKKKKDYKPGFAVSGSIVDGTHVLQEDELRPRTVKCRVRTPHSSAWTSDLCWPRSGRGLGWRHRAWTFHATVGRLSTVIGQRLDGGLHPAPGHPHLQSFNRSIKLNQSVYLLTRNWKK